MAFKMKGSPMKRNFGIGTDENPDTRGPVKPTVGPATERRKFDHSERIDDLQNRIEYLTNDIDELSADQSRKATAKKKELIAKRKAHKQKLKILKKSGPLKKMSFQDFKEVGKLSADSKKLAKKASQDPKVTDFL